MTVEALLSAQPSIVSAAFYGSIIVVLLWETLFPARRLLKPAWARWLNNGALWILNAFLRSLIIGGLAVSVYLYVDTHEIGLLRQLALPEPLAFVLAILLLDCLSAIKHRLFHEVPILWRFHVVHHSDLDCDISTSLRSHPLDAISDALITIVIICAIGASPIALLVFAALVFVLNSIRHGNVYIPKKLERALRLVLVTPELHRIHHSSVASETNRNYGVIFPWWDWLMGSYCAEPIGGQERMTFGLEYFRSDDEIWLHKLLTQPFRTHIRIDDALS